MILLIIQTIFCAFAIFLLNKGSLIPRDLARIGMYLIAITMFFNIISIDKLAGIIAQFSFLLFLIASIAQYKSSKEL